MKNTLLLLALSLFMLSCSSEDDGTTNNPSVTEYLPLKTGNYWVYETESGVQNGRDSLYIAPNDTLILGNSYTKFKVDGMASGFYSGSMDNNGVRKSGDELLLTGSAASLDFLEDLPLDISVSNFVIFKESASANTQLGNVNGTIQQQFGEFPIDIKYSLTSKAKADMETHTVNGETYTDVKVVETTLNLKVSTNISLFGTSIEIPIMAAQNVLVSTQYYAKNIGVVHVVTDLTYNLADFSMLNIELPIPQSGSEHQEEILVDYNVD